MSWVLEMDTLGGWHQRQWGYFRVIEEQDGYLIKELYVLPGKRLSKQFHNHREEMWNCIAGIGHVELGDNATVFLMPGSQVYIEKQKIHRLINTGEVPLRIIEIWLGKNTSEDDIVRIEEDH